MAYLNVSTRDGLQRVPLIQDHLRIGRLSSNDIILPYQQISREHAELIRNADGWWISDLDSTNGLQVNGRPVTRYPLQPGERIRLAPDIMMWLMTDDDELTSLATVQMPTPGQVESSLEPVPPTGPSVGSTVPPLRLHLTLPSRDLVATPGDWADAPADPVVRPGDSQTGPWTPPARATAWSGELPSNDDAIRTPRTKPRSHSLRSQTRSIDEAPPESDLFRRSRAPRDTHPVPRDPQSGRSTRSPTTAQLYLCETCGQRTAPDALACQFCHSPISHPCGRCGLSLLPSQERCARCQSLNPAYIRSVR